MRLVLMLLLVGAVDVPHELLEPGVMRDREIAAGASHRYRARAAAGEILCLRVEQRGADVVVTASGGDAEAVSVDRPSTRFGTEYLSLDRDPAGEVWYEIEIRASTSGSYRIGLRTSGASVVRLAAELAETEGARLQRRGTADDFRQAAASYAAAAAFWREMGEIRPEARALYSAAVLHGRLHETERGLEFLERALPLWRGDVHGEADTWNLIGFQSWLRDDAPRAVEAYREALERRRSSGDRCGEAQTLSNLGLLRNRRGEPRRALESFQEARHLCGGGQDPGLEASVLTNVGGVHEVLGDLDRALELYGEALPLLTEPGDRRTRAVVLNNMGQACRRLGRYQEAFDHYHRALDVLREIDDPKRQATVLNSLGILHLATGEPLSALERLREALALRRSARDRRGEAVTLNNLGQASARLERFGLALDFYRQALELRRSVGDRRGEAVTLDQMGTVLAGAGDPDRAAEHFSRALELHRGVGDLRGEARTLRHLAGAALTRNEAGRASRLAGEALAIHRRVGDRVGEAGTLRVAARAKRRLGDLEGAGGDLDGALEIVEALRAEIRDPEVRATFLADERAAFEDKVDLLIVLHGERPGAGYDRRALEVAEQARARSLKDVLAGPAASHPGPDLEASGMRSLHERLDDSTLLVEFALGEERSFLWAVTARTFEVFELAPRGEIEAAARRLHEAWSVLDAGGVSSDARLASRLSDLLLSSLGERLAAARRLAVVADGALHYVPFAALPMPGSADGEPLVAGREVVHLPSAAALSWRPPSRGRTVTVLADPVFDRADARIATGAEGSSEATGGLHRLAMTRHEARAIASAVLASAVPPEELALLVGAEARRDALLGGRLASSRVVHLATHGKVDSGRPELSGLMLSRFDEAGRPLDGFLSLADVYGLRLDADLVVLSGCETALGREIRGEGLVGLTHGFLHAGASRVIASLWRVQDKATAELMERFYHAFLAEGREPAAALRKAQMEMWRETDYRDPYHWAAFVCQGDLK